VPAQSNGCNSHSLANRSIFPCLALCEVKNAITRLRLDGAGGLSATKPFIVAHRLEWYYIDFDDANEINVCHRRNDFLMNELPVQLSLCLSPSAKRALRDAYPSFVNRRMLDDVIDVNFRGKARPSPSFWIVTHTRARESSADIQI
jgi:hypothetical protein